MIGNNSELLPRASLILNPADMASFFCSTSNHAGSPTKRNASRPFRPSSITSFHQGCTTLVELDDPGRSSPAAAESSSTVILRSFARLHRARNKRSDWKPMRCDLPLDAHFACLCCTNRTPPISWPFARESRSRAKRKCKRKQDECDRLVGRKVEGGCSVRVGR